MNKLLFLLVVPFQLSTKSVNENDLMKVDTSVADLKSNPAVVTERSRKLETPKSNSRRRAKVQDSLSEQETEKRINSNPNQ